MADSTAIDGVLGAANAEVRLSVAGFGGVAIQVQGTFSGTITFEASVQGQDFTAFRVTPPNSSTPATTTTTTGVWVGSVVGYLVIRARMSSYSSGQATVLLRADVPSPGGASGGGGSGSDVNLIEVGGSTIALGQAAMADSLPVVIASDQTAVDVNIVSGGGSGGTSSTFGAAFPATGTAIGVADPDGNMAALSAETLDYDTGAGTAAQTVLGLALPGSGGAVGAIGGSGTVSTNTNVLRVVIATDQPSFSNAVPISAASLPLPSGAATAANQQTDALTDTQLRATPVPISGTVTANAGTNLNTSALATEATLAGVLTSTNFAAAFGTAGTADAQVMSVQGIASMTPVQVSQATAASLNATVVGTGTFAAQVTAVGTVADDATTPGAPVMVGGQAKSPDGTDPGSVSAENDVARAITDLNRRVFVNANHPRSLVAHLDGSSAYTDQALIADPGDGFQAVITNIIGSTGAATALNFFLEEGSTKIFGPIYLEAVAGRGFCSGPMYLPCTASTAVTLTSSASIAQSFNVTYFIQAV